MVAGDFSTQGGMDQANYAMAWHLADCRNRKVTLVAHRVDEPLASHQNISFKRVSRPYGIHLLGQPLLDWAGRAAAARLIKSMPTTVLVNGGNCGWPGAVNWTHMVHHACAACDDGAPPLFRLKNRLSRFLFRRQEALCLRRAGLVLANSEKTRNDLIKLVGVPPERIHVLLLGCDPAAMTPVMAAERSAARRRLAVPDGRNVIVFIGALGYDANKGFDTLLLALSQLTSQRPLLLAAGGGRLDYWSCRVMALGLSDDVRLLGPINFVPVLFAAADLMVSPTRYDSYGLAVHEALCRGVPALVSRSAGVAERYPEELADLLLDDPNDSIELAEKIKRSLNSLNRLGPAVARLGEQLRQRSWDDMAAEAVAFVEDYSKSTALQDKSEIRI